MGRRWLIEGVKTTRAITPASPRIKLTPPAPPKMNPEIKKIQNSFASFYHALIRLLVIEFVDSYYIIVTQITQI